MLMEEIFERLREYQEILTKRVGIEREVDEIPKALDAQVELLARVKKSYLEKNESFQASETKVRELRQQLAEAEGSRESAEKQMDSISTQREYEALNKEIPRRDGPGAWDSQGSPTRGAFARRDRGISSPRRIHDPAPGERDCREKRKDQ